jgi:hypothetical protein
MGAEHDGFFTLAEMRRTAAAYRTEAEILPAMGHDLMLDQGWPQVADRINTWIRETPSLGATAAGRARAAILRFLGYSIGSPGAHEPSSDGAAPPQPRPESAPGQTDAGAGPRWHE